MAHSRYCSSVHRIPRSVCSHDDGAQHSDYGDAAWHRAARLSVHLPQIRRGKRAPLERCLRYGQLSNPLFSGGNTWRFSHRPIPGGAGRGLTGFMAGWMTPFALSCGVFALGLFAFLAATYLTLDTRDEPDLQEDFRRRSLWAGLALAPIALVVFLSSRQGAPAMHHELTRWWAPVLLVWTSLFAGAALIALWLRRFVVARLAAIGQVTLILVGWGLAQYPNLVTPDVTVNNAAAPEFTLRLLVIALGFGAILLLPSLAYLFYVFKRPQGRVS